MYCYLCVDEYAGVTETFCPKCKKIKHYISLWGDRVYEILDSVLTRDLTKQNNKVKHEIKKEIVNKLENIDVHKTEREKLDEQIKKELQDKFKNKKAL